MYESIFCTNCGSEFYLSEFKFTICQDTNHLMGVCPICNWNEFSIDDNLTIEEWDNYPEPKFYLDATGKVEA